MLESIIQFFTQNDYYYFKLATIPLVSGFIGWFTNWQAIVMTFNPVDFVGIKLGKLKLGWQGIIPANGPKMAGITVDLMTQKLIKVEEIFERLNPQDVANEMGPHMQQISENVVNKIMKRDAPTIWKNIPEAVKKQIFSRTSQDIPMAIKTMMESVKTNIHDLLDLKKMCVDAIVKDKQLVNEIFLKCGKEEFKFIEISGWWFGLIFGIGQMMVWHYFPYDWTLPVAGIIVGYATNWLALKMIFEPRHPKKYFGITFQGMFLKRQKEVSAEYAKIIAAKVLNSENLWEHMLNESDGDRMFKLIEEHVEEGVENATKGLAEPIARMLVGTERYMSTKQLIIKEIVVQLPAKLRNLYGLTDKAFDIENTMRERMQAMNPDDFVGVLRPAFEEEELKLILVGAVLGGLAGLAQLMFVFA
jgi:uncharacterized membrane protein YheB (UPF0754 family)